MPIDLHFLGVRVVRLDQRTSTVLGLIFEQATGSLQGFVQGSGNEAHTDGYPQHRDMACVTKELRKLG